MHGSLSLLKTNRVVYFQLNMYSIIYYATQGQKMEKEKLSHYCI